jgi:hypothetical protein
MVWRVLRDGGMTGIGFGRETWPMEMLEKGIKEFKRL